MIICIGTKIAVPGVTAANTTWEFSEGEIPGRGNSEILSEVSNLKISPDSQEPSRC